MIRACWCLLVVTLFLLDAGCGRRRPPDVVLITLDTTRADHIGCYHGRPAHTPTLDSLAAAGVLFTQAVTPVPLTLPSHASMLTGLNPPRHGVRDNGAFRLGPSIPVLTERLAQAGYRTGAFVGAFVLARSFGLDRGFETYDDKMYNTRSGYRTIRAALEWIKSGDAGRPFFLWVHLFEPHAPYEPSARFRALEGLSPYAQEVAEADAIAGQLLASLRAQGRLDHAVVIVAGDHGEGLGDHGEDEHGIFIYDETMRVPFLLSLPKGPRGVQVTAPVSLVDLAPTLLEASGAAPLSDVEGMSLLPLLLQRGGAGSRTAASPAGSSARRSEYIESLCPDLDYDHSPLHGLRTPRWKYIRAPRPELYNLERDPGEQRNLWNDEPDTARIFAERLDRYLAALPAIPSGVTSLSTEDLERLRSLGYLTGHESAAGGDRALPDPKDMVPVLPRFAAAKEALYHGRLEEAVAGFRAVLSSLPGNSVAALNLGASLINLDRPDEAAAALRDAWERDPRNAALGSLLADALRRSGRPRDAMEIYRLSLAEPTRRVQSAVGIARCLIDDGRAREARDQLATILSPGSTAAPAGEAAALLRRVDRYLELQGRRGSEPGSEPLRLELASAAMELERHMEARELLGFTSSEPRMEGARHRLLGTLAGQEHDYATALIHFRRAAGLLPQDPVVFRHLAAVLLAAQKPLEARDAIERALSLTRPDASLYYNKACVHARLGEVEPAFEALRRAVELGFERGSKILQDPDLASLREDPRLAELADAAARR